MDQVVVRRLTFACAVLALVLLVPTFTAAQDFPPVPHPMEGREECLACHETGLAGAPQVPANHANRTNVMCPACHQPAASAGPATDTPTLAAGSPTRQATAGATPAAGSPTPRTGQEAAPATDTPRPAATPQATPTVEPPTPAPSPTPASPKAVPHTLAGHENCLDCHLSTEATPAGEAGDPPPIPHPLAGRGDCLACHQQGLGGAPQIPDDHSGRTNDVCQACHRPGPAVAAASVPTAPAEPVPTPIAYPRAAGANTCLDCHSSLEGGHSDITSDWQRSIHAERNINCADCHGGDPSASTLEAAMSPDAGYIGVPAKADIPALCASCHADVTRMRQYDLSTDQYAKYKESIHGRRLAEGDTNVATCFDCHGGHRILKANDPASAVYPVNVPRVCASCHADKALMAPYNIPTNQFDLYQQSVHGHALLDNQDFRAPNCATCHGTHGAAPPGFEEVANVCGSCHAATQDYYLDSIHASAGDEAPKCVTCHGRYDVSKPSEALYQGAEPRHCGACHVPDSPAGQVTESLYSMISTAAGAYDEAEAAIQVARGVGMLVGPLEGRLREASTSLITARAAQHALNVDLVREQTDKANGTAIEVKASADAAVGESVFRRQAMVIAVAFIGLTIVALYLLKRELDRQIEEDS